MSSRWTDTDAPRGDDYDERNNLVLEFGRLVREFRPKMFVMENVPGLLGARGMRLAHAFQTVVGTSS